MEAGIDPMVRTVTAAHDSALLLTLMALMVVDLFMTPTLTRTATKFMKQLFRTHQEVMPGEKTLGERLVVACGVPMTLVTEALVLYCACGAEEMPPLASLCGLMLPVTVMFAVQYAGYSLTGYAFTSGENTRQWLSAFHITQACAALPLMLPAMGALFYPRYTGAFLALAGVIYVTFRIPLYIKEFRIFYTGSSSILYFFLYLCTLEIAPLIGVAAFAGYFSTLFC